MQRAAWLMALVAVTGLAATRLGAADPAAHCDLAHGRDVFAKCETCHDPPPGAPIVGPSLRGVIGRPAGTADGYKYSRAIRESGHTWSPDRLDPFLENPLVYLPGNRMAFAGLKQPEDRRAVICYLEEAYNE